MLSLIGDGQYLCHFDSGPRQCLRAYPMQPASLRVRAQEGGARAHGHGVSGASILCGTE